MTEQEWLTSDDPQAMLRVLRPGYGDVGFVAHGSIGELAYRASDRKLRLFACACCRLTGVKDLIVDTYEQDGSPDDPLDGRLSDSEWAEQWSHRGREQPLLAVRAALLRDIFGNPFRPVALPKVVSAGRYEWSPWVTCDVARIAEGIYAERAFERMPILGDALEDAGCMDTDCSACGGSGSCELRPIGSGAWSGACSFCGGTGKIGLLGHCRVPSSHVRGCWVTDCLLNLY